MAEYYQIASGELIRVTFEGSQKTDSDKRNAADGYREYAANFPKAENAAAAINNAAFYYNDIKDVVKTMETRHILIDTYPDSKYFTTHLAEFVLLTKQSQISEQLLSGMKNCWPKTLNMLLQKMHSIERQFLENVWAIGNKRSPITICICPPIPKMKEQSGKESTTQKSIKSSTKMLLLEKHILLFIPSLLKALL